MMASANARHQDRKDTELVLEKQEGQVQLNWLVEKDSDISYYTIEKSSDGKRFYELAILITGEEEWTKNSFSYQDKIKKNKTGKLYYRLRKNNKNGTYEYSTVRSI